MPQIFTIISCCLFMASSARAVQGAKATAKRRAKP